MSFSLFNFEAGFTEKRERRDKGIDCTEKMSIVTDNMSIGDLNAKIIRDWKARHFRTSEKTQEAEKNPLVGRNSFFYQPMFHCIEGKTETRRDFALAFGCPIIYSGKEIRVSDPSVAQITKEEVQAAFEDIITNGFGQHAAFKYYDLQHRTSGNKAASLVRWEGSDSSGDRRPYYEQVGKDIIRNPKTFNVDAKRYHIHCKKCYICAKQIHWIVTGKIVWKWEMNKRNKPHVVHLGIQVVEMEPHSRFCEISEISMENRLEISQKVSSGAAGCIIWDQFEHETIFGNVFEKMVSLIKNQDMDSKVFGINIWKDAAEKRNLPNKVDRLFLPLPISLPYITANLDLIDMRHAMERLFFCYLNKFSHHEEGVVYHTSHHSETKGVQGGLVLNEYGIIFSNVMTKGQDGLDYPYCVHNSPEKTGKGFGGLTGLVALDSSMASTTVVFMQGSKLIKHELRQDKAVLIGHNTPYWIEAKENGSEGSAPLLHFSISLSSSKCRPTVLDVDEIENDLRCFLENRAAEYQSSAKGSSSSRNIEVSTANRNIGTSTSLTSSKKTEANLTSSKRLERKPRPDGVGVPKVILTPRESPVNEDDHESMTNSCMMSKQYTLYLVDQQRKKVDVFHNCSLDWTLEEFAQSKLLIEPDWHMFVIQELRFFSLFDKDNEIPIGRKLANATEVFSGVIHLEVKTPEEVTVLVEAKPWYEETIKLNCGEDFRKVRESLKKHFERNNKKGKCIQLQKYTPIKRGQHCTIKHIMEDIMENDTPFSIRLTARDMLSAKLLDNPDVSQEEMNQEALLPNVNQGAGRKRNAEVTADNEKLPKVQKRGALSEK